VESSLLIIADFVGGAMDIITEWFNSNTGLSLQIFVVLFVMLLINFVVQRFLTGLHKQLDKTKTQWDNIFIDALRKPLWYFLAMMAVSISIQLILRQEPNELLSKIDGYKNIGFLFIVIWFLVRFVKEGEKVFAEKADTPEDLTTVTAIARLLRLAIIITGVLTILQSLGYSVGGVLAFGGVGGIAIGFAAKDLLSNFFGGLMIYLDRPFSVGDWIRSPDRSIEGTVEHIGWRLTVIRTFDKRPLYVPNSAFTNIAVENPSRMKNRRIYETIGLRYADVMKVEAIVNDVKAMLKNHPAIDNEQTMIVNFNAFNSSSVDFFVYTFTKTTDWIEFHEIKQDVLFKITQIVDHHGAEFAFPTQTLHIQQELESAC
jgi:MscS family membrane protein